MITDNYIKMCEQAEEIQKEWRPKIGDYYYEKGHHKIFDKKPYHYKAILDKEKSYLFHKKHNDNIFNYKRFWLPTLEQLFEMIDWDKAINNSKTIINNTWKRECREGCKLVLLSEFYRDGISNRFGTIKEILFAFVMYEKYHKIWTGEKWEKEK